jgi:hypothetical protein
MTEEVKQEVLEALEFDIKAGFMNEAEIFESIQDMCYEEPDFDEAWYRQIISDKFRQHQKDSSDWERPTDFERLAKCFDELIGERIVCLHNAGYTKSDGEGDCMHAIVQLQERGIKAIGFCYYHSQDLARAVDPEIGNLFLGFDSPDQDDERALVVANKIADKLKNNGFEISWNGTVNQRIEIIKIDWKKAYDDQDWSAERVITLLT